MSEEHVTPKQSLPKDDLSRLVISTAFELLGGAAHASAEAFQTVNTHVSERKAGVIEGVLKGNARFLEEMSHTMNSVSERFRPLQTVGSDESAASNTGTPAPSSV